MAFYSPPPPPTHHHQHIILLKLVERLWFQLLPSFNSPMSVSLFLSLGEVLSPLIQCSVCMQLVQVHTVVEIKRNTHTLSLYLITACWGIPWNKETLILTIALLRTFTPLRPKREEAWQTCIMSSESTIIPSFGFLTLGLKLFTVMTLNLTWLTRSQCVLYIDM